MVERIRNCDRSTYELSSPYGRSRSKDIRIASQHCAKVKHGALVSGADRVRAGARAGECSTSRARVASW